MDLLLKCRYPQPKHSSIRWRVEEREGRRLIVRANSLCQLWREKKKKLLLNDLKLELKPVAAGAHRPAISELRPQRRVGECCCQEYVKKIELRGIKQIHSKFSHAWSDNVRYLSITTSARLPRNCQSAAWRPPLNGTCAALSRYYLISPDTTDNSRGWKERTSDGRCAFFLLKNVSVLIQKVPPFCMRYYWSDEWWYPAVAECKVPLQAKFALENAS